MAEEDATQDDTTADDTGTQQPDKDWAKEAEKWKALARKHEQAARQNASAANELEKVRKASQSDQERLVEQARAEAAEQATKPLQAQLARYQVALSKGLSVDDLDFIHGETPEEIAASADKFLERIGARQQEQKPSFNGGPRTPAKPAGDMNNQIRRMAGLG